MPKMPRVGLDFDNTIVSYEGVFKQVALEKGLIDEGVGAAKDDVRRFFRSSGREHEWTRLQGEVYGANMHVARLYDGVRDTLQNLIDKGFDFRVVSHKTRHPFLGPKYDLHGAALGFLVQQNLVSGDDALIESSKVFFELTIEEKLARISSEGCTHFLDDLPEVLNHRAFPKGVTPLLFDPHGVHEAQRHLSRVHSWRDLPHRLAEG
jgi:hypothetical protein